MKKTIRLVGHHHENSPISVRTLLNKNNNYKHKVAVWNAFVDSHLSGISEDDCHILPRILPGSYLPIIQKTAREIVKEKATIDNRWDIYSIVRKDIIHSWPKINSIIVFHTILTLIAYDDCAHLLYSDPKEVKLLAKLGVPAAILLLPACIAFNETKELS